MSSGLQDRRPAGMREIGGAGAPLWIRSAPDTQRLALRVRPDGRAAAAAALGWPLGGTMGEMARSGGRWSARLGPDEWQLYGSDADMETVWEASARLSAGVPHALVDIGHRDVGYRIGGPEAAALLQAVCPLDIGAWPVGRATRTLFERVAVTMARTAPDAFEIECWRSYAEHVEGLFTAIGRDLAFDRLNAGRQGA